MTEPIHLGILGAGWVVREGYFPHLPKSPFRVAAIYDPLEDRAHDVAARLEGATVAATIDAVLAAPITALLVATPNPTHVELSVRGLRAGLNVLCEKPVAIRRDDVSALAEAEQAGNAKIMGASVCRRRRDVAQWLAWSRDVGELENVSLTWVRHRGVPSPGSWHTQASDGWTGAFPDLGYHLLDLLTALNQGTCARLTCEKALACRTEAPGAATWYGTAAHGGCDVHDRMRAWLRGDGCSVRLQVGWTDEACGDLTELVVQGRYGTTELQGLFGCSDTRRLPHQRCVRTDSLGQVVDRKEWPPDATLHRAAFGGVLADFARMCRGLNGSPGLGEIAATASLMEKVLTRAGL